MADLTGDWVEMDGHVQFELRDGWELRAWCGERDVEHDIDVARLFRDDTPDDAVLTCSGCGHRVFTVVSAEQREHLLHKIVSFEPFLILEEEF